MFGKISDSSVSFQSFQKQVSFGHIMKKISTNLLNISGGNFVIMTLSYSYLKWGDLLEEFMSDRDEIPCLITKFGFTYFRFHATLVDELIE